MTSALFAIGSNISPKEHLIRVAEEIRFSYPDACFSQVYQSAAMGMVGDDFLNCCCLLETTVDQRTLIAWSKSLEHQHGRDSSEGSWKSRTLDLDLLIYDHQILDDDLYRHPHTYIPASELVDLDLPQEHHQQLTKMPLAL